MSRLAPEIEEANPNLIPIMNLFTALIPFLLMSAVFYQMSMIQISVPVASTTGETDIAKEDDKITLNLQIFKDRFELSASSDTLEPAKLAALKAAVPRLTGGNADPANAGKPDPVYEELTKKAHEIKGDYIASDTVIIVPEEDIPYQIIIEAMDALRSTVVERDGVKSRVKLFPKVVLSSRVKA